MIRITLFLVLGLIFSCKSPKNTVTETTSKEKIPEIVVKVPGPETPSTDETPVDSYSLGEVKIWKCGPVIEIYGRSGMQITCNPKNLESRFQTDGLRLKLKYKEIERLDTGCNTIAIEIIEAFAVR
jgi:hypothetical protein